MMCPDQVTFVPMSDSAQVNWYTATGKPATYQTFTNLTASARVSTASVAKRVSEWRDIDRGSLCPKGSRPYPRAAGGVKSRGRCKPRREGESSLRGRSSVCSGDARGDAGRGTRMCRD